MTYALIIGLFVAGFLVVMALITWYSRAHFLERFRGLKIYIFYGYKGSGKSLLQAYIAWRLIKSYYKQEKKYPNLPKRKYYSSQKLSKRIEKLELGKHLFYWENPRELYNIRNADIGWDEIGKDLPAGAWTDTSKELKQVFSHLRKRGNRLFANTQIFEDIDVSFRRQIDVAYFVSKFIGSPDVSATLPNAKKVWGLVVSRRFDPRMLEFERDERKRINEEGWPILLPIRKKYIELYDTTMELPPYQPNQLAHIEKFCETCKAQGLKTAVHVTHRVI